MKWELIAMIVLASICVGLVIGVIVFFPPPTFLSTPSYLDTAKEVHQSFKADSNYFNCWDYSNTLVKELEANGYRAFVKKGFLCEKYCWRQDLSDVGVCCESHSWVAVETDNGLIEIEATTGRMIWS